MTAAELFDIFIATARDFGMKEEPEAGAQVRRLSSINAVVRRNIQESSFAYFGIIRAGEQPQGSYSGMSLVVFPDDVADVRELIIGVSIGSDGFTPDQQLASLPGTRRAYMRLNRPGSLTFVKTDFLDAESVPYGLIEAVDSDNLVNSTLERYAASLVACEVLKFDAEAADSDISKVFTKVASGWLATYADMRGWKKAASIRRQLDRLRPPHISTEEQLMEITGLLDTNRYVVLQGAPGCGKTFAALKLAERYGAGNVVFTQFHAETTYSDFVYGLEPDTAGGSGFRQRRGSLLEAIDRARATTANVLLIIDEINRANLANVLGPVFFLFEPRRGAAADVALKIGGEDYGRLPENLHVVATMNTADRSLAVVDFALRRRFVWYSMKPHEIEPGGGKFFDGRLFNAVARIFERYATDEELSLQPGQSYFIFDNDPASDSEAYRAEKFRVLKYGLMPLMKEYLAEGFLQAAKDDLVSFFLNEAQLAMYE